MNRCDECMHRDNCICVPYGCEAFEIDLSEHDKQIRAEVIQFIEKWRDRQVCISREVVYLITNELIYSIKSELLKEQK